MTPDETAKPTPEDRFAVGIIVARRQLKGPWASHAWMPVAALPAAPQTAPWTQLSETEAEATFYAGAHEVTLHIGETGHYRDNLVSGRPALWVTLHARSEDTYEVASVTADPYEGESMAEGIGEIVEAVPMPPEIQAKLAAFVEAFHIERTFEKRKRDRADPEALAHRAPARPGRSHGKPE